MKGALALVELAHLAIAAAILISLSFALQPILAQGNESNATQPAPAPAGCTDSDGGKDYAVLGEVTATDTSKDYCGYDAADDVYTFYEYYCDSSSAKQVENIYCATSCTSGCTKPCAWVNEVVCQPGYHEKVTKDSNGCPIKWECEQLQCADSDGGKSYENMGYLYWTRFPSVKQYEDICRSESGVWTLYERYCENNQMKTLTTTCPTDCTSGCKPASTAPAAVCTGTQCNPSNATQICSSGQWAYCGSGKVCSGGACVTGSEAAGSPYLTPTSPCADTDSGLNFNVKGTATGTYAGASIGYNAIYGQEPSPNTPKSTTNSYSTYYDHCSWDPTQLNEAFCDSAGKLSAYGHPCTYGCESGVCKSAPAANTTTATTSVCTGTLCNPSNATQICSSGQWKICPSGQICSNGACGPGSESAGAPYLTPTSPCTDTDGLNYYAKGTGTGTYAGASIGYNAIYGQEPSPNTPKSTTNSYSTYYDHCSWDPTQLNEAFCDSAGKLAAIGVKCPYGCESGVCLPAASTTPAPATAPPSTAPPSSSGVTGGGGGGGGGGGSGGGLAFPRPKPKTPTTPPEEGTPPEVEQPQTPGNSGGEAAPSSEQAPGAESEEAGGGGAPPSVIAPPSSPFPQPAPPPVCTGCTIDGRCVGIGYIANNNYCVPGGGFAPQRQIGQSCSVSYECVTYLCANSVCASPTMVDSIFIFFKRLFGVF